MRPGEMPARIVLSVSLSETWAGVPMGLQAVVGVEAAHAIERVDGSSALCATLDLACDATEARQPVVPAPRLCGYAAQLERSRPCTRPFDRPSDGERAAVLDADTKGLGVSAGALAKTVALTGPGANEGLGFTFSDLRTRLLPEAVLRAYPDRPLADDDLVETAQAMMPSPSLVAEEIMN